MGWFSDGSGDYNRELKTQRTNALNMLDPNVIGAQAERFQAMYAPAMAYMGAEASVGANVDVQTMEGRMARLGLGDSGMGMGVGLRTGSNMATNRLRAQLAMDSMEKAFGLQQARAGTLLQGTIGMQPQAGGGRTAIDYGIRAVDAAGSVMAGYGALKT